MKSALCLTLRFLDPVPQFHGRGDDGDPEWPPSPFRLFQALVSASATKWREDQFQKYPEPALQWLENIQPSIVTPRVSSETFGFRMYVPNNSGDLMTAAWARGDTETSMAKFRVEKDVRPTHFLDGEAIHYLFALNDGDCPHFDVLAAAARSVTHLGWGVDMVAGDATIVGDAEVQQFSGEHWLPSTNSTGRGLRVPTSGSLDDLIRKHTAFLNRLSSDAFKPVPPLTAYQVIGYRRTTDPTPRPCLVFELRKSDGSFFPYPQERLIHIAGMVRHLAIERMKFDPSSNLLDPEAWVDTYVGGHVRTADNEHRQFSYLPLPSIGHVHTDPSVRRVMIAAPPGDEELLEYLGQRLDGEQLQPTPQTKLNGPPPMLVRVQNDRVARCYTDPANTWASVTSVILPGHDDHKPSKTRKLIETALRQSGIEQPCEFEWGAFSHFPKSLSAHKYDKNKRPTGYIRPDHLLSQTAVHLKLRFDNDLKVPGPLVIGAGRHCGFGLMAGTD